MVYENGMSNFNAVVVNRGSEIKELKYQITLLDSQGKEITKFLGYVGDIRENREKQIHVTVTMDISNAKDILYEISE
ncbi:hypothetical protein D3C80_2015520 [compost metagenome]